MQFVDYSIQLVTSNILQVNGDTLFMTGNFKEFKVESHSNESWDEHNAMASTAVGVKNIPTIFLLPFFFNNLPRLFCICCRTILQALMLPNMPDWI